MAKPVTVGVLGLAALRRDIARLTESSSSPLLEGLRRAGLAAAEPVAAATRAALPRFSGTLAGDVRVTASRTGATARMGRGRVPYAGPVEFGGYPGDREYLARGRYMFPAAQALAEASARAYSDQVARVLERADVWTNTSSSPANVRD
jgi:hypothetical protein